MEYFPTLVNLYCKFSFNLESQYSVIINRILSVNELFFFLCKILESRMFNLDLYVSINMETLYWQNWILRVKKKLCYLG